MLNPSNQRNEKYMVFGFQKSHNGIENIHNNAEFKKYRIFFIRDYIFEKKIFN